MKTYRRLWPIAAEATISYHQLGLYYENHKRLRRTTVFIGPALLFLLTLLLVIFIETPSRSELSIIKNAVASEVYSADSVLLGRYYIQDRTEIKYKDIAPVAVDALIATEDVRFYDHEGVDYLSLGRVLVKSILQQDESAGGGSTLTQQLAKNLYPRKHYWMLSMLINKLRELITAQRLENVYSKEDLITLYLNTVPFADNVYGIQAASQRFFSTQAKNLTVNQAAVLIGMLKATHYYNPRLFPDRARERRNVVLTQMVKYNKLEKEKAAKLKTAPLKLKYSRTSYHEGLAPYFREYLKTELIAW
ncbi:MAG: transglycosylase domain-containing protein, partial [Bacteroidota bacterium]